MRAIAVVGASVLLYSHAHPYPSFRHIRTTTLPLTMLRSALSKYPTISGWCFHSAQSLVLIFLFKPAFWVAFFVNASTPNELTFRLLELIAARGGQPIMRPGGITMDSMIYDPFAGGF